MQLEGGYETIELAQISGDQSSSALESVIRSKLTPDQLTQFSGMHTVTFKDGSVESITDSIDNSNSSLDTAAIEQRIDGLPYWQDSLWNSKPLNAEGLRQQQLEYLNLNKPFLYPSAKIVFVRYQSILADTFAGLRKYRELGNDRLNIKVVLCMDMWWMLI